LIYEVWMMLSIGFALGLVHALDADHIMAVSVLSNLRPGFARTLRYCANWALGHGCVLLISGLLLFGLGIGIPDSLIHFAEIMVGVFLIAMGIFCFWRFRRQRISLVEHHHGDLKHRHWQLENDQNHAGLNAGNRKAHAPVMIGILHGFAGSAPALALVPVVAHGNVWSALAYLALFSIGVMLAMLLFGFGFGSAQKYIGQQSVQLMNYLRHVIAFSSVAVGGYWLSQAF
jgi:nickel/cobalt exporter